MTKVSIQQALHMGLTAYEDGRFETAEKLYKLVLQHDKKQAERTIGWVY